jgi:hypothetical protein
MKKEPKLVKMFWYAKLVMVAFSVISSICIREYSQLFHKFIACLEKVC